MKRNIVAAGAAAAILISANAAAYGLYCENSAASGMTGYPEQISAVCAQFEEALNSPEIPGGTSEADGQEITAAELYEQRMELYGEFSSVLSDQEYSLAEKLIDYDLLLRKLELEGSRYSSLDSAADEMSAKYLVGECTRKEYDEAEKQRSDKYYELESLLFEVSSLKSEIEEITGETLRSDFDFSTAYLITDALGLSAEELSEWGVPGTICTFCGSVQPSENPDITAQYTAAVKNYYSLGESLRTYVDAAQTYEKAADEYRLGTVSPSALEGLKTQYEDAKYAALVSKADYAKSLLELDKASGGALTAGNGISSGLAGVLSGALPENLRGSGLWLTRRSGNTVKLSVQALPISFDPEKDSGEFEVRYDGKLLCSVAVGKTAVFDAPEPAGGVHRAVVKFRRNGVEAGEYEIDIYSPFGEFLED